MSLNFTPTGSWRFAKKPQFVEEETYGVLPLAAAGSTSTKFTTIGHVTEATAEPTPEQELVRVLGDRDLFSVVKLGLDYAFSITYRPVSTTFMRYGTELPDMVVPPDATATARNGTNGVSLSILMSAYINGTEKWLIYKGVNTEDIEINVTRTGGVEVTQNFRCKEITGWVAEPLFAPAATYATDPATDPWSSLTGGTTPMNLNKGAGPVEYKTNSYTLSVAQNLGDIRPNGTPSLAYLGPTNRDVTCTFDTWVKDSVLYDDMVNDVNYSTLAYTLNSVGPKVATVSNAKITGYERTQTGGTTDFLMESITWVGKQCTVTA